MKIGIQLYSVSGDFKKDNRAVIEALAGMGYRGLEFAFTFGSLSPTELADLLKTNGMETVGFYSANLENVLDRSDDIYRYSEWLKNPYVTVGSPGLLKDWDSAIAKIGEAGIAVRKSGMRLLYHNHMEEINPLGKKPALSILAERTDPGLVMLELDTHFIAKAGENPLEWLEKYRGRVPVLHVKDIKNDGSVAEAGEGILDMHEICRKAWETGVEWLIVEFHLIDERTPMESAMLCFKNLSRFMEG
jgi:sugar phosphate isomerase/epimerase